MDNDKNIEKLKRAFVATDDIELEDFAGSDALCRSPEDIKREVQSYAIASLPGLIQEMVKIAKNSTSNRDKIEAAKFVKSVADGDIKAKKVVNSAKTMSDEELAEIIVD